MKETALVSYDETVKVAKLARLHLQDTELKEIQDQLSKVLENFKQIADVSTEGVSPLMGLTENVLPWREDKVETTPGLNEKCVSSALQTEGNLFKVPPTV